MSVSVTKSGFNVREKLKQLQKPIGLKGSELMRAETAQEAGSYLGVGRRNLCINGNFKIWQRGTSIAGGASGNTANGYKYVTADRWQTYFYNTYARQDTVLPNGERVYSFRETFNTTRLYFDQVIEDGGRIFNQGDYITVSFWAKTSGPSTGVSVGFYWYTGPNFAGGTYTYSNLRKNVIIEGSEWKYYTVTALLPTNADNRPHLAVEFDNYSPYGPLFGGSWSQLDGTDYWEFANIQIEKGKVATEFEHRSYGEELALCQRYFQKSYTQNNYLRDNSDGGVISFIPTNTSDQISVVRYEPEMRNAPSLTVTRKNGGADNQAQRADNTAAYISIGTADETHKGFSVTPGTADNTRHYRFHYYADAEL